MENLTKSFRRRSRIIIGVGIVTLLLALGALIAAAIAASNNHDNLCCTIFDDGRGEAQVVATRLALSMSQLLVNPTSAKAALVSYFASHGVFSTIMGNTVGPTNIDSLFQNYINSPGETGVSIDIKNMYWDYKTSTLTVEETWTARTTVSKQMWNSGFVITTYPANTTYTTDDVIIMTFNCHGKLVRYRQISSVVQRVSTYSTNYPEGCSPCDPDPEHPHHPHHPHPPQQPMVSEAEVKSEAKMI